MMFDGPADEATFRANGEEYLNLYRNLCGLKPDAMMLDVGSGIGRKTLPLTGYLSSDAVYHGIDVNRDGVLWCRDNITAAWPQFRFRHVDVRNAFYNQDGAIAPWMFQFPFAEESFDFVVLASVFTHMQGREVAEYLAEVRRVLKPDGVCLASFFLYASLATLALPQFPYARVTDDAARYANADCPEQAIAFSQDYVAALYHAQGLSIKHIHPGTWSGGPGLTYQDLIVARRIST